MKIKIKDLIFSVENKGSFFHTFLFLRAFTLDVLVVFLLCLKTTYTFCWPCDPEIFLSGPGHHLFEIKPIGKIASVGRFESKCSGNVIPSCKTTSCQKILLFSH